MNWIFRRNEQIDAGEKIPLIQGQILQGKIRDVLIDLAQRYDSIVIDVSGSDTSEQRTALSVADIFIAPLRPSQNDLETVKRVSDFVEGAKESGNTKLKAFALLNVAPTNPSIDEVKEAQSALSVYKDILPLLSTIIYDRKIYRDAFVEGKGVVEMKNEKAIQEIENLVEELFA
jgi:chromosome partitioning protein